MNPTTQCGQDNTITVNDKFVLKYLNWTYENQSRKYQINHMNKVLGDKMEGTAKASKHVKRNGIWQDPRDQTVANEMRPQECRPLPGIPWQHEGFEGDQPGTRTIVVNPPILNRPPPVWIKPHNAEMPMAGQPPVQILPHGHGHNIWVQKFQELPQPTQVEIRNIPGTSTEIQIPGNTTGPVVSYNPPPSRNMGEVMMNPDPLPSIQEEDILDNLALAQEEHYEDIMDDVEQLNKVKITTNVNNIKMALSKKLPLWQTIALIISGAEVQTAEASQALENHSEENGKPLLGHLLMILWGCCFLNQRQIRVWSSILILWMMLQQFPGQSDSWFNPVMMMFWGLCTLQPIKNKF